MKEEFGINKLLSGINHTLNIVNKAVPVYTQAKPLVKKGIDTYNNIKNKNAKIKDLITLNNIKNQIKKDMNNNKIAFVSKKSKLINNINNPKFFI